MAEVLASLKKIGGNGEQYTETVLWTNPAPTAQFAGQAVTLSDSISNYKYIKITNNFSTAYPTIIGSTIFPVEDFKTAIYPVTGREWQPRIGMGDASTNYARRVYYVSETSIQITSANLVTSGQGGSNNSNAIPLEILGINELAHQTVVGNYDVLPFQNLAANVIPSFTTKGKAKAIWMTCVLGSGNRGLLYTNVNPSTGVVDNDDVYAADSNSLGTFTARTQNFVVTDNSVTLDSVLSSTNAFKISLAYTYE